MLESVAVADNHELGHFPPAFHVGVLLILGIMRMEKLPSPPPSNPRSHIPRVTVLDWDLHHCVLLFLHS